MVIGEYMTTQNYLMINESTNVVDNVCVWDGNSETWQPPSNYLMLVKATTPALIWNWNKELSDWVLQEQIGDGDIGFTWNATTQILTTNQEKPKPPKPKNDQPDTNGTVTI
jgi:hypothetical protein